MFAGVVCGSVSVSLVLSCVGGKGFKRRDSESFSVV